MDISKKESLHSPFMKIRCIFFGQLIQSQEWDLPEIYSLVLRNEISFSQAESRTF